MTHIDKILILCWVVAVISPFYVYGQPEAAEGLPLLRPQVYLIRDENIRSQLMLTKKQIRSLDRLCDELDPLLFAMRDVPENSTDPKAVATAEQINSKLVSLKSIFNQRQRGRLEQLAWQYAGTEALLYPTVQDRLGFTSEQTTQLKRVHNQAVSQQYAIQKESPQRDDSTVQRNIEKIRQWQVNQIFKLMNTRQRQLWQLMLGDAFDFSQLRPLSFRAPELEQVTEWINTKPLSMRDLRGRVVIVHFWTFGCHNCMQNYPVYRQWAQQYDPKEVFMLGIHTPEIDFEKDVAALRERIAKEQLSFAVAVDNDKANWNAWFNRVWPSVYLVDKKGQVRHWWYGELRWQGATGDQWIAERIEQLKRE